MARAVNKLAASVNDGAACDAYLPSRKPGAAFGVRCTMEQHEKNLALARRLYAEQEARIRQQAELIMRLKAAEQPTDSAEETLKSMKRTLVNILVEIARLGRVGPNDTR